MQEEISDSTKKLEEMRRDNQVMTTKNGQVRKKKIATAEATVRVRLQSKVIRCVAVCVFLWLAKNVVTVPNMRNMKYPVCRRRLSMRCM